MAEDQQKTCFVVMGFRTKTDYQSKPPRTLDLDKSYQHLIKPAVEAAGLKCVRADEIQHSGVIDKPMYKQLLAADVVVADLSTSNANALYELGVRHALRPYTTIVIAEDQFKYPFDVNHTTIRKYKHMGEDIGFGEVQRFQKELKEAIEEIIKKQAVDSPVYTFLPKLQPPLLSEATITKEEVRALPGTETPRTIAELVRDFQDAKGKKDFAAAREALLQLTELKLDDPYYLQQLALVTYKSEKPSSKEALMNAREILLEKLDAPTSSDPETLGLWGAVHKRLWEETSDRNYLNESILAYERGFFLKNDYYNGINLAFMLNLRSAEVGGDEGIADRVLANRIRRQVIDICEQLVREAENAGEQPDYWVLATLEEAWYVVERGENYEKWKKRAEGMANEGWMRDSTLEQQAKLDKLLG